MILELLSLSLIVQLFVLLSPFSSFPVLMEAYKRKMNVKSVAINGVLMAFAIALVIVIIGPSLFKVFGISPDSFKIAGGVVLFLLGLDTVRSKSGDIKATRVDGFVSIIATPLLTGPAAISFIAITAHEIGKIATMINLVPVFVLVGAVFIIFSFVVDKVNIKIVSITSKVLGLFLIGIAIQMIVTGIKVLM